MASGKLAYSASAQFTFGIQGLASSAALTAGWSSLAVSNAAELAKDYLIGGKVKVGATPTSGKSIYLYVYAGWNDTPAYPDTLLGTDAAVTLTSADIRNAGLQLIDSVVVDSTAGRVYPFRAFSLRRFFGGSVPQHFGLWLVHDTVAALDATGGNHGFWYKPIYDTVA